MAAPLTDRHPLLSDYEQAQIEDAAEDAYMTIALERDRDFDDVHRMGVCHQAAEMMVSSMVDLGAEQRTASHPWLTNGHSYITMMGEADDTILVDPTWKQFAQDDLSANAPMVMIGTEDEFKKKLLDHGVPASRLSLWDQLPHVS